MEASIDSSNAIKVFVREYIHPHLKAAGFTKTGLTFYRLRGDIIDVINVQGNSHNGWGNSQFYLNYSMDSLEFQAKSGQTVNAKPFYNSCLYSRRLHEGPDSRQNLILMEQGNVVNFEQFGKTLLSDIDVILEQFDRTTTVQQLVALVMERKGLWQYQELCRYLVETGEIDTLKQYLSQLKANFAHDDRWPIFSRKISEAIGSYVNDSDIQTLLK